LKLVARRANFHFVFVSTYSVLGGMSLVEVGNRTVITRVTTTRDPGLHVSGWAE